MFDLDLSQYMVEMIYELVPGVKRHPDKLQMHCPICGDGKKKTSKRCWFYIKTASVFCWNAGCAANNGMSGLKFLSLVSGKSINEVKTDLIKRAGTFSNVIEPTPKQNIFENLLEQSNKKHLIEDKILDADWTDNLPEIVENELERRKIYKAPYINNSWKIYYDKKAKRMVIPWTDDYWQERALFKFQESEGKYLFPSNLNIQKPIFGLNMADLSGKYIFLLEGVFDSIWVKGGLAVGSLKLSNHQNELLEDLKKTHEIVYFMDNQWKDKSSYFESEEIFKKDPFQKIFVWPKELKKFKDVNESIIYSDKLIKLWMSDSFLYSRIFNGVKGLLELQKIK